MRVQVRIIPACAGFTFVVTNSDNEERDHPRMRGVYVVTAPVSGGDEGSSPHARGLPVPSWRRGACPRIIPACAGFTTVRYSIG